MGFFKKIMNQTRKPQGFLGGMMLDGMNNGHAKVADWGLAHLTTIAPEKILEVGCGGGRNAYQLLQKYPSSKLTAVDYSETSLEKTKQFNSEMIKKGRCNVQKGDVSALNIDEQYDLATAFETIYFWPGLEKCFSEVNKALKPGGTFMIVNEATGDDQASLKYEKMVDGMKCHTVNEIESALSVAGFSKIKTDRHESKPWVTVIAKK
ncbi:MAG: class I SAM-dependent methyltransferase [Pseudobutyrivibrio sp.]|uniref:class I SAM-dependent DNA methyltransferase n=1 Tax=Pseudobutyrivibrio sp. TaxID=2014367 RepID=UPI0025DDBB18|nr:class I SAM-dependent methyltransferase [Pseudobutyrivibrio sp.]MBE5903208.1 class I SAM-dependent methyltransferase [Pseudobutyrivibrio sp.]